MNTLYKIIILFSMMMLVFISPSVYSRTVCVDNNAGIAIQATLMINGKEEAKVFFSKEDKSHCVDRMPQGDAKIKIEADNYKSIDCENKEPSMAIPGYEELTGAMVTLEKNGNLSCELTPELTPIYNSNSPKITVLPPVEAKPMNPPLQ